MDYLWWFQVRLQAWKSTKSMLLATVKQDKQCKEFYRIKIVAIGQDV